MMAISRLISSMFTKTYQRLIRLSVAMSEFSAFPALYDRDIAFAKAPQRTTPRWRKTSSSLPGTDNFAFGPAYSPKNHRPSPRKDKRSRQSCI